MQSDNLEQGKTDRGQILNKSAVTGATALAGFSILHKAHAGNQDVLKVGVVGCGGRGTGAVADILTAGRNVELVAMADAAQAQIEKSLSSLKKDRNKQSLTGVNVTPERCYVGLDAYKKVIDSDIDIVILSTPPGFRPEHFEYAINAGKNIFCEKPCATDPVGVRRIRNLNSVVDRKGISVVSGFQRRHTFGMIESVQRIHDGNIGNILSGRTYYNATNTPQKKRPEGISDREWQFVNWYRVDWLSGDHYVEQAVHNIDLANWVMNVPPVSAYGMGGVQYFHDLPGNIYDHFTVEYTYANGARITSMSRQIPHTDSARGGIFFGDKGTANYMNGAMEILGDKPGKWEGAWAMLGRNQEHVNLLRSIRESRPMNHTMILCDTTLMAIMGREAAYSGKNVTWQEMMDSDLSLAPKNIEQWDGSIRPVPKPGMDRS